MGFEELALMGGSKLLTPVPVNVREMEILSLEDNLVRRDTVYVFTLPPRLRRSLVIAKPLYMLITGARSAQVVAMYRSLVLALLAAESIEDQVLEPIIVYAPARVGSCSASMLLESLIEEFGRGYYVADYGWSSVAYLLGRRFEGKAGDKVLISCEEGESGLCRLCGILLHSLRGLDAVIINGRVLRADGLEGFLATGRVEASTGAGGESGGDAGEALKCGICEGYVVAEGGCLLSWLYYLLSGSWPRLGSFPDRTGLGLCESLAVIGFKRLGDVLRVWRVL